MGQAAAVVSAFARCACCTDCARYVLNSGSCHSKCSECCELDIQTNEIEIASEPPSEEEEELDVGGFIRYHRTN